MSSTEPHITTSRETPTAVLAAEVPMAELVPFFDRAFATLGAALAGQGVAPTGPAFALYRQAPTDVADLEVGFPTEVPIEPSGEVVASSLPAGRVARLLHEGSYDSLGSSWERLRAWIDAQGLVASTPLWEVYVTEPSPAMDPGELVTELNWLVTD